jgi:DNA-binding CsgD family transcriptional regulator
MAPFMSDKPYSYSIYFDFIESYMPSGFLNIKQEDPILQKLDVLLEAHDQFFSIFDMGHMNYLFSSKRCTQMLGVETVKLNLSHWLERVHPEHSEKLGMIRAQLFRIEKDLFMAGKGSIIMSYNLKMLNSLGGYNHLLVQDYFFYTPIPRKSVLLIQVVTNIDGYPMKKGKTHYYLGDDLSLFRYPDEGLINISSRYSIREMEIIKLISQCFTSEQIAEKLFISVHTVNTHRSNILEKSGKSTISELIYELKEQGLL